MSSSVTTMDTTSHNFTWEVTKVSDRLDINLQDVAIIDANNIYIAGFIPNENEYEEDYNIVHWDGEKWSLERIYLHGHSYEINSIFGISKDDIWISNGNFGHWDGENWSFGNEPIPYQKIWSDLNNNVWFVGDNGRISHFDGENWHTQESGTEIYLTDIYGVFDNTTGNWLIYVCGYNYNQGEAVILRKENLSGWQVFDNGQDGPVSSQAHSDLPSLWVKNLNTFFTASFSDVLKVRQTSKNSYKVKKILTGDKGINRIRGNDSNDIFVGGEDVQLRHFNGKTWHHFTEIENPNITIYSLDFKDNIVVAVSNGSIFMGRRN